MSRHDVIIFLCGALCGVISLTFMQMARSFGRRDVEGELLASLTELRRSTKSETSFLDREEYDAMLRRADLAISLATAEAQS